MKQIFLLLASILYLSASEFPHIQPIAVEEAPLRTSVKKEAYLVTPEPSSKDLESKSRSSELNEKFMPQDDNIDQAVTLKINFARNRYDISDRYIDEIKEFVEFLEENNDYLVLIYGHTDSRGSEILNKELSRNRAKSVQKALEEYGIKSIRLTAIGKGELNPIADNSSEAGRAKNRRIEIDILE